MQKRPSDWARCDRLLRVSSRRWIEYMLATLLMSVTGRKRTSPENPKACAIATIDEGPSTLVPGSPSSPRRENVPHRRAGDVWRAHQAFQRGLMPGGEGIGIPWCRLRSGSAASVGQPVSGRQALTILVIDHCLDLRSKLSQPGQLDVRSGRGVLGVLDAHIGKSAKLGQVARQ